MKKILYILLIFISSNCFSQDFEIKSNVDKNEIYENEYIRFIVDANQSIGGLRNLNFTNFNLLQGPFTSESHQSSFINGKVSSKDNYTYTFLLSPKKTGTLTIESVKLKIDGTEYKTAPIEIIVKQGKSSGSAKPKQNNRNPQEIKTDNSFNKDFFAKITTSKSNPFLSESILLTYRIYQNVYSNVDITDFDISVANDFWTENIDHPNGKQYERSREQINGKIYDIYTLKKEIAFPQKIGKITIPSFKVDAIANRDFFGRGGRKITIKSNDLVINVKPLIKNPPISFKGQVGKNYKLEVEVSKNELSVNEALDYKITISGNGNLKELKLPNVVFPSEIEKYPEETKDKLKVTNSGIKGYKSSNHLLIPRSYGEFEIPSIEFTYFDINKKKYITLKEPSQIITVNKNDKIINNNENLVTYENESTQPKKEIQPINEDIRFIKENSKFYKIASPFFGTIKYLGLIVLIPSILFLIILILNNKNLFKNQDRILSRKTKKEVLQKFKNAEKQLSKNNTNEFYNELYNGWMIYISNKLKIKKANLNKENIFEAFEKRRYSEDLIKQTNNILNECEMAQYSQTNIKDAKNTLNESRYLLKKFDKNGK